MFEIAEPGAAIFLGDCNAQHPEVSHFFPQLGREIVLGVDLRRTRGDLARSKLLRLIANQIGGFTETKIENRHPEAHGIRILASATAASKPYLAYLAIYTVFSTRTARSSASAQYYPV